MPDQRCPRCGGYQWYDDVCQNCGYRLTVQGPKLPPQTLSNADIKKFHELVIKETEEKISQSIPQLSDCIFCDCKRQSLFYDHIHKQFECFNPDCKAHGKPIPYNSQDYIAIIEEMQRKRIIKPIRMRRFEYDIYTNYLKRLRIESVICFEATIID
jgi:hypothetical protein